MANTGRKKSSRNLDIIYEQWPGIIDHHVYIVLRYLEYILDLFTSLQYCIFTIFTIVVNPPPIIQGVCSVKLEKVVFIDFIPLCF